MSWPDDVPRAETPQPPLDLVGGTDMERLAIIDRQLASGDEQERERHLALLNAKYQPAQQRRGRGG